MSRKRTGFIGVALVSAGAIVLAGCSGTADDGATNTASENKTITIGIDQAPDTYNTNTATANSVYNAWVDNATQGMFITVMPDGSYRHNTEFGTMEKTSDNPLTVKYTFAEKAQWSDGTPMGCADALLQWVAMSGVTKTGQKDEDGLDVTLFQPASTNGYDKVKMPTCNPGDKEVTFEFTENYADWEPLGTTSYVPAHIVAQKAGLSNADNDKELIDAIKANDLTKLKKVADFWNTGWAFGKDLASIPDVAEMPTSGYYKYDNGSNGSLTLVKNDKWWGTPAKTGTIVFKYVDAAELVKALENGEIDIFQPSAVEQDTVTQLKAQGDKVKFVTDTSWTYSHIDLAQSKGAVFEDLKVRQAFLKCVPRQDLVDKFVTPVFPGGTVLDSHEYFPGQPEYDASMKAAPTSTAYDKVDLEGAKQLLTEAGKTTPVKVRIMRAQQSELRGQQVQLIKDSCDKAGFEIIDTPDADWSSQLSKPGAWDAVLFAWSGSGVLLASESQYVSNGAQNFGKYSDATIDDLWKQITKVTSADQAAPLKYQMEEQLWKTVYNVVLYANPNMLAWNSAVQGAVYTPTQYGPTWNVQEWSKS